MDLTPVMERFVLHWGEMGARWGVNRSVAQIHALLYLSPQPLHAEDLSETLSIARSNVSTSIRELQSWGLIHVTHQMGDRRDHFIAESDPWEIMFRITQERKRREIDPTLAMLRGLNADAVGDAGTPAESKKRIRELTEFMDTLTTWHDQVRHLPRGTLVKLLKMGAKVAGLVQRRRERNR
jgi:DNA-binding transcriptional regulator GbsR (MarR family)